MNKMLRKLILVAICCTSIDCKRNERKELENIYTDIEDLEDSAKEAFDIIDILRDDIGEHIDNLTMSVDDETVLETETQPETEDVIKQNTQLDRVKAQLIRVENKLKSLKNYFNEEKAIDHFLDNLDKHLDTDFKDVENNVDQRYEETVKDVDIQLSGVRTSLASVDTYARSRNVEVAGVLYHGGIGSPCLADSSDCRVTNSSCYGGQCQCDAGLSYNALIQECVLECRNYGDTFQTIPNYILRDFNTLVLNDTSLKECKEECRQSSDFTCRSVEYFPRWYTCYLSDTIMSNGTDLWWEYNEAGNHYQRDCAYF